MGTPYSWFEKELLMMWLTNVGWGGMELLTMYKTHKKGTKSPKTNQESANGESNQIWNVGSD